MTENNRQMQSAIIYNFPAKPRLVANRIAEQLRRAKEFESARSAPVAPTSGWYHEEAMADVDRRA
jgi:hypothetical protein